MGLGSFVGVALVVLVPAVFVAAVVGRIIHGAPVLIGLSEHNTGDGIPLGMYFVHPGFAGSATFWIAFLTSSAIAEAAGIYSVGYHRAKGRGGGDATP